MYDIVCFIYLSIWIKTRIFDLIELRVEFGGDQGHHGVRPGCSIKSLYYDAASWCKEMDPHADVQRRRPGRES